MGLLKRLTGAVRKRVSSTKSDSDSSSAAKKANKSSASPKDSSSNKSSSRSSKKSSSAKKKSGSTSIHPKKTKTKTVKSVAVVSKRAAAKTVASKSIHPKKTKKSKNSKTKTSGAKKSSKTASKQPSKKNNSRKSSTKTGTKTGSKKSSKKSSKTLANKTKSGGSNELQDSSTSNNSKNTNRRRKPLDMSHIAQDIAKELGTLKQTKETALHAGEFLFTGIKGFDELLTHGIPKGSAILVAGGAGSGKTLFCLQTLYQHALQGEKCLYLSFEESTEKLHQHMEMFGWNTRELEKKGNLRIERISPFDVTRSVDALLMKAKGELLIDVDPVILPKNYKPNIIAVDSLTAIASAFTGKADSYRIYIEQLFRFFENMGATSFLITETEQVPKVFSHMGVEEFLADGVVVMYSIRRGNIRENAIEVLKLRGAKHQKRLVAMQITSEGVKVYPEQEVFGSID